MTKAENQSSWLKDVDLDQNVKGIEYIKDIYVGGLRKWFLSKVLSGNYRIGKYNNTTNKKFDYFYLLF